MAGIGQSDSVPTEATPHGRGFLFPPRPVRRGRRASAAGRHVRGQCHLAAGYGHLNYRGGCWQIITVDRATRVQAERAPA